MVFTETSERSGTTQRRIVKAKKAAATHTVGDEDIDDGIGAADEEDDESCSIPRYLSPDKPHSVVPKPLAMNPSIARELEQEQYEESRQERIHFTELRQRHKREQHLQKRRTAADQQNSDAKKPTPQPNPFSRFLSVFSVQPAHPEHKRALERDREEATPPSGKKFKPTDEPLGTPDPVDADEEPRTTPFSNYSVPYHTLAAAAAVLVVAVTVAYRAMKRRNA